MIYIYIGLLFILTVFGIYLNKYLKNRIEKILSELKSVITKRTGKEIIENFTTNFINVEAIDSKNYYSPTDDSFYLSKEIADSTTGESSGIAIYLILLMKSIKQKTSKSPILVFKKIFPELFIFIFALIALFSASNIFLLLSIAFYLFTLLCDLILNGSQYFINEVLLRRFLIDSDFHLDQREIDSVIKYIEHRKQQEFAMFFFNPVLVPAYYFYFVFGGKSD